MIPYMTTYAHDVHRRQMISLSTTRSSADQRFVASNVNSIDDVVTLTLRDNNGIVTTQESCGAKMRIAAPLRT